MNLKAIEISNNHLIVDKWESSAPDGDVQFTVLPDGCRDLIVKIKPSYQEHWFISPYFHTASTVTLDEESISCGFRFAAGASINEQKLLSLLQQPPQDNLCVNSLVEECVSLSDSLNEVLSYMAINSMSVNIVAKKLGVSTRTLQRLLVKETGLTPSYWLRLSRVRSAGRYIVLGYPLSDVAAMCNYSDQSHLTRECTYWFKVSPMQLKQRPDLFEQLFVTAYN